MEEKGERMASDLPEDAVSGMCATCRLTVPTLSASGLCESCAAVAAPFVPNDSAESDHYSTAFGARSLSVNTPEDVDSTIATSTADASPFCSKGTSSQYVGVSYHQRDKAWQASTMVDGKKKVIARGKDEAAVARAYDAVVGPQGRPVNFPEPGSEQRQAVKGRIHKVANTSQYRGVSRSSHNPQKWLAQIRWQGVHTCLGTFDSEEEAARRYDQEAALFKGAHINFPGERVSLKAATVQKPEEGTESSTNATSSDSTSTTSTSTGGSSRTRERLSDYNPLAVHKVPKTSSYRGVTKHGKSDKWVAQITINKIQSHLGLFVTEEDAARRYDQEASRVGRKLNFPPPYNSSPSAATATSSSQAHSADLNPNAGLAAVPADPSGDVTLSSSSSSSSGTTEPFGASVPRSATYFSVSSRKTSKHRGVTRHSRNPLKWVANITVGKVPYYLGVFNSEDEAARRYDEAAAQVGRALNFPENSSKSHLDLQEGGGGSKLVARSSSARAKKGKMFPASTEGPSVPESAVAQTHALSSSSAVPASTGSAGTSTTAKTTTPAAAGATSEGTKELASKPIEGQPGKETEGSNGHDNNEEDEEGIPEDSKDKDLKRSSKYVGVSYDKQKARWLANATVDGKQKSLGPSKDEEAMARKHDEVVGPLGTPVNFKGPGQEQAVKGSQAGTSRHVGVCWNKHSKKWQASIKLGAKPQHLGAFETETAAAAAYDEVAALHHKPCNFSLNSHLPPPPPPSNSAAASMPLLPPGLPLLLPRPPPMPPPPIAPPQLQGLAELPLSASAPSESIAKGGSSAAGITAAGVDVDEPAIVVAAAAAAAARESLVTKAAAGKAAAESATADMAESLPPTSADEGVFEPLPPSGTKRLNSMMANFETPELKMAAL